MDGREMERLAQRNKNWVRTGFSQEVPVKRAEVPAERPTPVVTQVPVPKSESPSAVAKGITAIRINGRLHGIRKVSDSDTSADKLNLELLEFMFQAYGRHGLLPVSDLVAFVERNNLTGYLELQEPSTPKDQEQFDKQVSEQSEREPMNIIKWIFGFFRNDYRGYTPAEVEILKRLERVSRK